MTNQTKNQIRNLLRPRPERDEIPLCSFFGKVLPYRRRRAIDNTRGPGERRGNGDVMNRETVGSASAAVGPRWRSSFAGIIVRLIAVGFLAGFATLAVTVLPAQVAGASTGRTPQLRSAKSPAVVHAVRGSSAAHGTRGAAVAHDARKSTAGPTVTKIAPTTGPATGSTVVKITGKNFTSSSTVEFGSSASPTVTFVSSKKLEAVSPPEAQGMVNVRVFNGSLESPVVTQDEFTFTAPVCPSGTTESWIGAVNSSWSDAANWNQDRVPESDDVVCIPAGSPELPVELDTAATVDSLTNNGGLQITGSLAMTANGSTSIGPLALDGGTISGSSSLTVTGTFTTTGGTLKGPGTVTVASSASFVLPSGDAFSVTGGQFVNKGTATLNSSANLWISAGVTVTNSGSFTLDSGSAVDESGYCADGVFANTGTLDVTPGASNTASLGSGSECGLIVNNSGTIKLTSGTLQVAYDATLNIDTGSSFSGPGTLYVNDGSVVFNVAVSVPTLQVSGSAVLNVAESAPALALDGGTISGSSSLTVTGTFTTTGGTLKGPGTVTVASSASFVLPSGDAFSVTGGQFVNKGTATLNSSANLWISAGVTVTNSGSFTLDSGSAVDESGYCADGVFANTGTLDVTPGASNTASLGSGSECGLIVNNSGTIKLTSGTLQVAYDATLNIDTGSSFSGPGTLYVNDGSVVFNVAVSVPTLQVSGSAVLNVAESAPALALDGGTISGSSSLTVTGTFTTTGGTLKGPGTVTVASSASFVLPSGDAFSVTGGQFVNKGTATLNSSANLWISAGVTVTNSGSFTLDSGSAVDESGYCADGVFANTGTLDVTPGASNTASLGSGSECGLIVNNSGTIKLTSGTLQVAYDATLNIDTGSSFSGPGTLYVNDGSVVFNVAVSVPTLQVSGSAVLAQGVDVAVTSLSVSSGTIQLVAQNAGSFGGFTVGGAATLSNSTLYVNAGFAPTCGTSVTAIAAASVSGPFQSVTGPVPSGGTWEPTSTSTTAGGVVSCTS